MPTVALIGIHKYYNELLDNTPIQVYKCSKCLLTIELFSLFQLNIIFIYDAMNVLHVLINK